MPKPERGPPTQYNPSSPFPSSTAKREGEEIGMAAATLLGMKNAQLTPEEIAEFDAAVDEELNSLIEPAKGGRRRKMRGGDIQEVVAKSKDLWSAVLKTMATPENAAIGLVATTVGIASPALVHSAFLVARTALDIASKAVTPETVALTSCAALIYHYYGDKLIPKEQPISQQIAIERMNNAVKSAKAARRGSATLREVVKNFKEDFDKSKSLTNWETVEGDALEVYKKLEKDTAPSTLGVDTPDRIKVSSMTNTPAPSLQKPGALPSSVQPSIFSAESKPTDSKQRWGKGGSRQRRLSAPTRKVKRSSSSRSRRYTRRQRE